MIHIQIWKKYRDFFWQNNDTKMLIIQGDILIICM